MARLQRRPGQKEERYRQLLQHDEQPAAPAGAATPPPAADSTPAAGAVHAADSELQPAADDAAGGAPALDGTPLELAELHERLLRLEREVAELRGAGVGGAGEPR